MIALCRTFGALFTYEPVAGTLAPACILLPLRGVILWRAEFDKPALSHFLHLTFGRMLLSLGIA